MNRRQSPDNHPVLDMHMSGEHGSVGHNDVIAEYAIVGDMCERHQVIVTTDHRSHRLMCSPMEHRILPDHGPIADFAGRHFVGIFQILGSVPDDCSVVNNDIFPDSGTFCDERMVRDGGAVSNHGAIFDHGKGSDRNAGSDFRL